MVEARQLLDDLTSGRNPVAHSAQQIVSLALSDANIRRLIVEAAAFPKDAVVPFANATVLAPVCPNGWSYYRDAENRFILGGSERFEPGTLGGQETVTLEVSQMPSHEHIVGPFEWGHTINNNGHPARIDVDDGPPWSGHVGRLVAEKAGGSQPHNNMPPYIALYFCKKD